MLKFSFSDFGPGVWMWGEDSYSCNLHSPILVGRRQIQAGFVQVLWGCLLCTTAGARLASRHVDLGSAGAALTGGANGPRAVPGALRLCLVVMISSAIRHFPKRGSGTGVNAEQSLSWICAILLHAFTARLGSVFRDGLVLERALTNHPVARSLFSSPGKSPSFHFPCYCVIIVFTRPSFPLGCEHLEGIVRVPSTAPCTEEMLRDVS